MSNHETKARPRLAVILPTQGFSGAEKYVLEYCVRLAETHEITAIVDADCPPNVGEAFRAEGFQVATFKGLSARPQGRESFLKFLLRAWSLRRLVKSVSDKVMLNLAWPTLSPLVSYALYRFPKPAVIVFHLVGEEIYWEPYEAVMMRQLLSRPKNVPITVAKSVAGRLSKQLHIPESLFTVSYNGVPERAGLGPGADQTCFARNIEKPMVMTVASVFPHKGCFEWIRIAERVVARYPQVRFSWAGTGDSFEEFKEAVANSPARDNLEVLGRRSDVAALLDRSAIFLFLSSLEGHPYAVLEAQSLGLLVISTDVDGIGETLVDGRDAILLKPVDEDGFVEALCSALESPERYFDVAASGLTRSREYPVEAAQERLDEFLLS